MFKDREYRPATEVLEDILKGKKDVMDLLEDLTTILSILR